MKTVMRRHRLLILSLLLGLSAFVLSYSLLGGHVRTVGVVVALRDVEPYVRLASADLTLVEVPEKGVSNGVLTSVSSAVGRYTRSRLVAGQTILKGHLLESESVAGLSLGIPAGFRLMLLPVPTPRALGGLVKEGERVDVIVAAKAGAASYGLESPPAFTAIRGLLVSKVVSGSDSDEFAGIVVLASPDDCERLATYLESSTVYLALASKDDIAQ